MSATPHGREPDGLRIDEEGAGGKRQPKGDTGIRRCSRSAHGSPSNWRGSGKERAVANTVAIMPPARAM